MKKILSIIGILLVALSVKTVHAKESWSTIYNNYKSEIDQGISCTYKGDPQKFSTFNKILVNFNSSGWSITIDNFKYELCNNNECSYLEDNFTFGERKINFGTFSIDYFFNMYRTNVGCPRDITVIREASGISILSRYVDPDERSYFNFSLDYSGSTQTESKCEIKSNGCLRDGAECKNYIKDVRGKNLYFQLGRIESQNDLKYYAVADNANYNNCRIASFSTMNDPVTLTFEPYTLSISTWHMNSLYPMAGGLISEDLLLVRPHDDPNDLYLEKEGDIDTGRFDPYTPEKVDDPEPLDIKQVKFCETTGVLKAFQIIGYILYVVKIIVPLLLIILGSMDLFKGIVNSGEKPNTDVLQAFVKRVLIAVIIFLIPTVLDFLVSLIDGASEIVNDSKMSKCTDCLLDPFGDCKTK